MGFHAPGAAMTALALVALEPSSIPLQIFTKIPGWALAHAVRGNEAAPLFRQGEVAVYKDEPKTFPEHGCLYVVEFGGFPMGFELSDGPLLSPRRQALVQAHCSVVKGQERWSFRTYAGPIHWADGPYPDNIAMAQKVLGPVIGIYAPSGRV